MQFAPVLIPTLNRHEHLRRCLESLSRCTWADQTEVFVALDYPPSEKYVEGWKKNAEFLDQCGDMGFKKLHIIKRNENYGTWKSGGVSNLRSLLKDVRTVYDRYIVTEDDNVFSPAFLDYMNKGFELFKDDEDVYALCGYRYYVNIKSADNTFFRQNVDLCGWGIGRWTSKKIPIRSYKDFRKMLSVKSLVKIYKRAGAEKAIFFLNCCNNQWNGRMIDMAKTIYLILADKNVVMPTISLVKNIGMDNSGVNFRNMPLQTIQRFENQEIFGFDNFEYKGDGFEYYDENQKIYKDEYPNKLSKLQIVSRFVKGIIKVLVFR